VTDKLAVTVVPSSRQYSTLGMAGLKRQYSVSTGKRPMFSTSHFAVYTQLPFINPLSYQTTGFFCKFFTSSTLSTFK